MLTTTSSLCIVKQSKVAFVYVQVDPDMNIWARIVANAYQHYALSSNSSGQLLYLLDLYCNAAEFRRILLPRNLNLKTCPVEVEILYRECLQKRRATLGDVHPDTLRSFKRKSAKFGDTIHV